MTDQLVATGTATSTGFTGADVDGLDHLAQEFTSAAQVCNEVKAACEVIVAVASMFGPFAAGFITYLKTVVIPWLTKIAEALQAMAKLLSLHSQAQKDASSSSTSLPSYVSTGTTPPAGITPSGIDTPPSGSVTVTWTPGATTDPSTVASLDPSSASGSGASNPAATGDTVGLLTVPVTIAPDGTVSGLFHGSLTDPTTAGGSLGDGTVPTDAPLTVPTTPTALAPTLAPTLAPMPFTPSHDIAPLPSHSTPLGGGSGGGDLGGGSGGGTGGGGVSGGGMPDSPITSSTPTLGATPDATLAADQTPVGHAPAAAHHADPQLQTQRIGSHDGLWGGLGQATGIGAGGAALARAVLVEARRRAEGTTSGGVLSPFDADADGAARSSIFDGALG